MTQDNNKTRLFVGGLLILLSTAIWTACKKTALLRYDNPKDAVFFIGGTQELKFYSNPNPDIYELQSYRHFKFSFYNTPFYMLDTNYNQINDPNIINLDTLNSGLLYLPDLSLFVTISGDIADYDRSIAFSASGNGKSLTILPDSLRLPAGATRVMLPIRFLSPPPADTTHYQLILHLESNAYFDADRFVHEDENASSAIYTFGNFMPKNELNFRNWNTDYFGEYSGAKIRAIVEANWQLKGPVIDRINDVTGRKFNSLDYKSFFYFLFYKSDTQPVALFKLIQSTIIANAKMYLLEQKKLGKPILDQDGKEVTLP